MHDLDCPECQVTIALSLQFQGGTQDKIKETLWDTLSAVRKYFVLMHANHLVIRNIKHSSDDELMHY